MSDIYNQALQIGEALNDQYRINATLGEDGFGIKTINAYTLIFCFHLKMTNFTLFIMKIPYNLFLLRLLPTFVKKISCHFKLLTLSGTPYA